jgi:nucleoside-diphosphate kinase
MATFSDSECYGFHVEWHDAQADLIRVYELTVFVPPRKGAPLEAAMYDPKGKKPFVKRMPIADLRLEDLHVGSTVTIHGRQLRIKDWRDQRTRQKLETARGVFTLLTAPSAFSQLGRIIAAVEGVGLTITRFRLVGEGGSPVVAMQVAGGESGAKWDKLSSMFVQGALRKASDEEADPYFEDKQRFPTTAAFDNCTLAIIRPHAVKSGNVGAIVTTIMEAGFEISAAKMLHLQRAEASELTEVYMGVLPYYSELVDGMSCAPCLAMELRGESGIVEKFRELCGPHDVDMARHLRPQSLRARFGISNAQNAVHASDMEGDAESEVRYVFDVLE